MKRKSKKPRVPDELSALLHAGVLRDMALEEDGAGKVAREILRAECDGREEQVQHLIEPLMRAIFGAVPNGLESAGSESGSTVQVWRLVKKQPSPSSRFIRPTKPRPTCGV